MPSPPNPVAWSGLPVAPPGSAASWGSGLVSTGFFTCGGGGAGSVFGGSFAGCFPQATTRPRPITIDVTRMSFTMSRRPERSNGQRAHFLVGDFAEPGGFAVV